MSWPSGNGSNVGHPGGFFSLSATAREWKAHPLALQSLLAPPDQTAVRTAPARHVLSSEWSVFTPSPNIVNSRQFNFHNHPKEWKSNMDCTPLRMRHLLQHQCMPMTWMCEIESTKSIEIPHLWATFPFKLPFIGDVPARFCLFEHLSTFFKHVRTSAPEVCHAYGHPSHIGKSASWLC